MIWEVKIRLIGSAQPYRRMIVDKPSLMSAVAEAIERHMLETNTPIICGAVVPFDDYDFQCRRIPLEDI